MKHGHGIEQWLYDHKEDIDFWCLMTVIGAVLHAVIVGAHWLLSAFLGFTYLWVPIYAWVFLAMGRVAVMYIDDRQRRKEQDDDTEMGVDP